MNEDSLINPQFDQSGQKEREEKRQPTAAETYLKQKGKEVAMRYLKKFAIKAAKQIVMAAAKTPWGWIIGIALLLLLIIIYIFFGQATTGKALNADEAVPPPGSSTGSQFPPITGFALTLTGPDQVDNCQGQDASICEIRYTISYTYDDAIATVPLESITIYNDIPQNTTFVSASGSPDESPTVISWPLEKTENQTSLTITLRPTASDVIVSNKAYARSSFTGPSGGASSNTCTQQFEGSGYCSVQSLMPYFNGDETKAIIASMICQRESTSNPFVENLMPNKTGCNNDGVNNDDYSIGLFQVNLIWNDCSEAPYAYDRTKDPSLERCQYLISEPNRSVCRESLKPPASNIAKMLSMSSSGNTWTPWSTWSYVQRDLASCNINL